MSETNRPIYVTRKADMPEGSHYAILVFRSMHIPGDERSRTNPGHGYPERTEHVVEYQAYLDRAMWEEGIRALEARYPSVQYSALIVTVPKVRTQIVIGER